MKINNKKALFKTLVRENIVILFLEGIFTYDARVRFKKYIKRSDIILDIGALTSSYTKGLSNKVVAIDILPEANEFGFSEKNLDKLKRRPNIEAIIMDVQNMDFEKSKFDVVIITEVLEHIPDDKKAVLEILRVMKSGGYLLLTVPNLERVPLIFGIKEHLRHYNKNDLVNLFGSEKILL